MIKDIANEGYNVNELAKSTAMNLITKSFKVQCNPPSSQDDMNFILKSL